MTIKKKYIKPVLTKYEKVRDVTTATVALEGTASAADCTLTRCTSEPPAIKG
ncbi:hypothetical protein KAU32_11835 [bacterium]|nr:hypothetical protein [bacterium]